MSYRWMSASDQNWSEASQPQHIEDIEGDTNCDTDLQQLLHLIECIVFSHQTDSTDQTMCSNLLSPEVYAECLLWRHKFGHNNSYSDTTCRPKTTNKLQAKGPTLSKLSPLSSVKRQSNESKVYGLNRYFSSQSKPVILPPIASIGANRCQSALKSTNVSMNTNH